MGTPTSDADRQLLLRLARSAIADRLAGRRAPEPDRTDGRLSEPHGVFVTLTEDDSLRGCIGTIEPYEPLWQGVRSNAEAAAFRDPRFPPLSQGELGRLRIEISVLSALEPLSEPMALELGRHGLVVELGGSRGLLLPQVATDHDWDRTTFLDHTCRKAGLAAGCWRDPRARLYVFTVEHFAES